MVLIDTATLTTLPQRELVCGLAEVVKHALIADRTYFEMLEANLNAILALQPDLLVAMIAQSCRIKAGIVRQDEREESGVRALLNFGHTVGHALEAAAKFETLRHGEAVIMGMFAETFISHLAGKLAAEDFQRAEAFLRRLPLKLAPAGIPPEELGHFMQRDKKAQRGTLRLVLLHALGAAEFTAEWPHERLHEALAYASTACGQKLI